MGLFDFIKKKETQKINITNDDSLKDIGIKLINAGLISIPKDNNHNIFGEKLDKLVDGELPWGWVHAKSEFIKPRDDKLFDLYQKSCKAKTIDEEKELIKQFLDAFYTYKKECEELGECYIKYFTDMFEKCHNSTESCFSMATKKEERLAFINQNYENILFNEQLKNKLLATLSHDVEDIIKNNPGILQSELIKKFDPIIKSELSQLLYNWDKNNKIHREKKGRSYSITLK